MAAYETVEVLARESAPEQSAQRGAAELTHIGVRIGFSDSLTEVENVWRALEARGVDSPGQCFDFVRIWTETFEIPRQSQLFVAVEIGGRPLMAIALERKKRFGLSILAPFATHHVGVNAPLVDRERMALLSDEDRTMIWARIRRVLDADVILFGKTIGDDLPLFPGASAIHVDCLFRAEFESWEDCNAQQLSRSRRKHDKQQAAKLAALGEVAYEEISAEQGAAEAMDVLFRDKAARFAEQGITDPFASPQVRAFYRSAFCADGTMKGHMQVLRLDGAVVAARYNLVSGTRMFCLISSKSPDPTLQPGSPGKQVLSQLMRRIYDSGMQSFDMGAGLTDEKRHWCNVQKDLFEVMMPATGKGRLFIALLSIKPALKAVLKRNAHAYALLRALRARLAKTK